MKDAERIAESFVRGRVDWGYGAHWELEKLIEPLERERDEYRNTLAALAHRSGHRSLAGNILMRALRDGDIVRPVDPKANRTMIVESRDGVLWVSPVQKDFLPMTLEDYIGMVGYVVKVS